MSLPVGTPLDETVELLRDVEQKILDSEEDDDNKIDTLLVMCGFDTGNMEARSDEGEHSARFKVLLKETADHTKPRRSSRNCGAF